MSKKIKHLVVDTTAFLKAADLQNIAENIYTIQEVSDEIVNDKQRRKLVVLPYDLNIKDVFTENVKFITEFSKKTGDYTSLSATDIKVMALTYQLQKEKVGIELLKTEPAIQRHVKVTGLSGFNLHPEDVEDKKDIESQNKISKDCKNDAVFEEKETANCYINREEIIVEPKEKQNDIDLKIVEQIKNINLEANDATDDLITRVSESGESSSEEETDSDGGEWITPSNLAAKKKEMDLGEFEDKSVEVACITSDFAMQNVLKQIGLYVTAIDGRVIKQLRTYIFRCTTCFKTTSVMTKLFCPKCGHATLKKVGVSIDDDGNQHIHINGRKPLTARGKKFSLPTPRGGQHFQYPILTEDQHIHKSFTTKLARKKVNALDPDYTAGFSPFATRDVNSKSAVLGVRAHNQDIKYWMKHYSKGKKK